MLTPSKVALYEGVNTVTYAELWDCTLRAAAFFAQKGKKGDRVILSGSKNIDFVYNYLGAQLAGLITMTVDPAVNSLRLQRIFDQSQPIGIYGMLTTKDFRVLPFPDLSGIEPLAAYSFPDERDIADILFTTGTTGLPKGVVLTHRNELAAATNINAFIGNTADDVELLALPVSHSFGLGRLRCTLLMGGTLDLLGSFASMKKFFREMEERQVTGFGMVPASWNYICKCSGEKIGQYASQLKYIEIGSAFMPVAEKEHLMALLPQTRICMHYGLTEASRSCFMQFDKERDHLQTIGYPSPNVEVEIFDEQGRPCRDTEEGEVCVKGDHVCAAYWGDRKDEYEQDFYQGYFRTGDWGYHDTDGRLYLKSRKKELINVGGKKVSPIEVEEVINRMPQVLESACVGIPDAVLGEVVKAFVVKREGASCEVDEVKKYVMTQLEGYKVPAEVAFIESLPKTASGKLQRLMLKEM